MPESTLGSFPNHEVVAAVIEHEGKLLCAQRKPGGDLPLTWEFPGGKVEPGETRLEALERELHEELGLRIHAGSFLMTVRHRYESFFITMHVYRARVIAGEPSLNEHAAIRWLKPDELYGLDWAPADMPVVELLAAGQACPFCGLPKDQLFYDGELVVGIWDSHPVSPGHALLIPKRHAPTLFDATPEERAELMAAVDIARNAIEKTRAPDGYNIGFNIGEAAGQTVFHAHLHVIPRYTGDAPNPRGGVRKVLRGAREEAERPTLSTSNDAFSHEK
jgi:ATP adenylyltransferase